MYIWEPAQETQWSYGHNPSTTPGLFYDILHVEQSAEGWHGFLLGYVPPGYDEDDVYEAGGLIILDEELLNTRDQATLWCEQRDTAQLTKRKKPNEE